MKDAKNIARASLIFGICFIVLGVISIIFPASIFSAFAIVYGIVAIVSGIVDIVFYIRSEQYIGFAPTVSLVAGVLSILAGGLLLLYPGAGEWIATIIFPIWFISHCIARLTQIDTLRLVMPRGYCVWNGIIAVLGIIWGIMLIFEPQMSLISAGAFIGIYMIAYGIDCIMVYVMIHKSGRLK
ncbi:MAG: HdeD family acid-resistance protein [Eubacterium sp.]|jgi:uncharacterized membrane protein HdeD (DUF308 family)